MVLTELLLHKLWCKESCRWCNMKWWWQEEHPTGKNTAEAIPQNLLFGASLTWINSRKTGQWNKNRACVFLYVWDVSVPKTWM